MIYYIIILILLLILLILTLSSYSLLYPGRIKIIDSIRFPIQGKIATTAGNLILDGYKIHIKNKTTSPKAIKLMEIIPELKKLNSGDIFFTRNEKYISSKLIKGNWKHSGIFLGNKSQFETKFKNTKIFKNIINYYNNENDFLILDSNSNGVEIRKFKELSCLNQNSLLINLIFFRIKKQKQDLSKFISFAFEQLGKPYDFDFSMRNSNAFYCSELLAKSLEKINIKCTIKNTFLKREVIYPIDLANYIMYHGISKKEFKFISYFEKENNKLKKIINLNRYLKQTLEIHNN